MIGRLLDSNKVYRIDTASVYCCYNHDLRLIRSSGIDLNLDVFFWFWLSMGFVVEESGNMFMKQVKRVGVKFTLMSF